MARRPRAEYEITAEDKTARAINSAERGLRGLSNAARTAAGVFATVGVGFGASELTALTDQYNRLSVRVRTATRDTGDFEKVQRALLSTSRDTGTAFEASVDTFQAISRVREDIGATTNQMLALTRVTQQLGVIGGASGDSLRFGLRQFNQALAAGVFRAEEFNSIVENIPELAKRIADGFGVTQGQLRQMVLDGKLFSDEVVNVLLRQAPEIAAEFAEIPTNLERTFSGLTTSIGGALSKLDQRIGFTEGLAERIENLADTIAAVSGQDQVLAAEREMLQVQEQLKEALEQRANAITRVEFLATKGAERNLKFQNERVQKLTEELDLISKRRDALLEEAGIGAELGQVGGGGASAAENEAAAARRQKLLDASQKTFDALHEQRLRAMDRLEALENFRLQQQLENLTQQRNQLMEHGGLTHELEIQFQQAREDAETAHRQKILDIRRSAAEEARRLEREEFQVLMEVRAAQHEEELAQILGFRSARDQQIQEMERAHQDALLDARIGAAGGHAKLIKDIAQFEQKTAVQKTNFILQTAQDLTAGLATTSRTAFNINRAAALSEAVVNTAQGVTKSLATLPPPQSFIAATLVGLKGAAQIATIQSTQFGGSGSGITSAGPGSGIPSLANESLVPPPPVVSAEDRNRVNVRVEVVGDDDSVVGAMARSLRFSINEGDEVLIDPRSRQAAEIRGG